MTIIQRPNGRFAVQTYDPATKRMRQVGTYTSRRDAKRAEAEAVATRRAAGTGAETVGEFAARWMTDFPRRKPSTTVHNLERVKRFVGQHHRRRLDSITVGEARKWCIARRSDLPALRAMFNDARSIGLVDVNPFAGLKLSTGPRRRDLQADWLTADDVDQLARTALNVHGTDGYGPVFRAMVMFAAYTGVRPGELFALEWADLDGDLLHVRRSADSKTRTVGTPKNGRERTVVLPAQASDPLTIMPVLEGSPVVFPAPRGGRIWAPHFNHLWGPVRAAFGRPTMHFYELRHFTATHLLDLGLSPADCALQLGHEDNGKLILSTYGHPSAIAAKARIKSAFAGHDSGDLAALNAAG